MSTKKAVRKGGNPKKKEEEEEEQERKREEEEEVDEEEEEEEEGEEGEEDAEEEDEEEDEEEGGKDKRAPEEPGKRSGVEDPECTLPTKDLPEKERRKLDKKVREKGETVVPGGTGGKTLETQERLAEGRCKGGHTRREQLGREGYQNMGRKGGLSTKEKSSEERENEEGIEIDESTYRTRNK